MRQYIFSFIALVLVAQFSWADKPVTAPADIPAYYAGANNKSGTSLYNALNTITNVGFSSLGYDGAIDAYQKSDVYPTDPNHPDYVPGRAGQLWDMYGACSFTSGDECGSYKKECDCYNREHSIPKSWWGSGKNNMYSDIFHLAPTDGYVNNRRSSYAFGEVSGNPTYSYNGCKLGSSVSTITTDRNTLLGTSATCSGTVFEPRDEYKGDFARGYLGMIAKYSNTTYSITSGEGSKIFESFSSTTHFGLTKYGIVLLMKWHREDPVSQKEIDRNNGIQKTQGNRNPFIDYPYLAEYIWGEKNGQTVDMSQLMPSTDPDFVPGVSNGWRGDDTPTPVVKYGVTWSVNGAALTVDSIKQNMSITTLPAAPTSCSTESNIFVGWTTAPIAGTQDEAPAVLYTRANQFPAVTADVIYYAVFAHAETVVYGPEPSDIPFVFDNSGLTFDSNGVSVVFAKAGGSNDPKYYTTGDAIRCYGGNTITVTAEGITQILFEFGSGDGSNAITANPGTFSTNTWTGSADEVVFTIGGTSGHRRVHGMTVTRNGAGGGEIYSEYMTNCGDTTAIENHKFETINHKLIIDGHMYIMVGEHTYTVTGQRVK